MSKLKFTQTSSFLKYFLILMISSLLVALRGTNSEVILQVDTNRDESVDILESNRLISNPSPGTTRNPFDQTEAENWDVQEGTQGTQAVEYVNNGDYVGYNNMDFGVSGASGFTANVSSDTSGGDIEIRLDSPQGNLVGTCNISNTGSWTAYVNTTCSLTRITGIHNLYLRFAGTGTGFLLNLSWFKFTRHAPEPPLLPPPNEPVNIGRNVQVRCPTGRILADDPIVFPNQPGESHEHLFFGNTGVTAFSTFSQLLTQGTTCINQDDTAAYWVPTLYDSRGHHIRPRHVRAYYYSNTRNTSTLQVFPPGLRIIAGDRDATSAQPEGVIEWLCRNRGSQSATHPLVRADPPTCLPSQYLSLSLRFPDCIAQQVNGQPMLDSSDHRRHMAYSDSAGRCPETHPMKVPKLRLSVVYEHRSFYGGDFTLGGSSSSPMSLPRYGYHADFWNSWNQPALESLVNSLR